MTYDEMETALLHAMANIAALQRQVNDLAARVHRPEQPTFRMGPWGPERINPPSREVYCGIDD